MATLSIILNTFRPVKDGTYPLVFQVIEKRKKKLIYTPFYLDKEEFDKKKRKARNISGQKERRLYIKKVNLYVTEKKKEIELAIERALDMKPDSSVDEIVQAYKFGNENQYLLAYFRSVIDLLEAEGREGTALTYKTTLSHLSKFTPAMNVRFEQVTAAFVRNFIHYLRTHLTKKAIRLKENSINEYMRVFRAVYNRAQSDGLLSVTVDPFRGYHFVNVKTVKKAVDIEVIRMIKELDLSKSKSLDRSRDIFLFSFYCRGMPFVDMAYLKKSEIENNAFSYIRNKTGQPLHVSIEPELEQLIDKYRNTESEYVLPILGQTGKNEYLQYRSALKSFNRNLKKIGRKVGVSDLSGYVPRHSWASRAYSQGISVSVISESLGHTSVKTTYSYLKNLRHDLLDNANKAVIDFTNK